MRLKFTVMGKPKPLGRARHGKNHNVFTPREDLSYQSTVWMCALRAGARQLCFADRPVHVRAHAFFDPPKKNATASPQKKHVDVDNLLKQLMDAFRPAWHDDSQVVWACVSKHYGTPPRLEVEIHDEGAA